MNILMVGYTFYDEDMRVRRYSETLAEMGHCVDFVGIKIDKKAPSKYTLKNVNIYTLQYRNFNERKKGDYIICLLSFLLKTFFFISFNYLKKKYKIIHVHNMPDFEVFATLIPRLMGAKIILDIHDIFPEFYLSKFPNKKKINLFIYKIFLIIEKLCCMYSHHVIISNHLWYEKIVQRSVKKEKCTTILNYPSAAIFHKRIPPFQKNSNKYLLFYHGSISKHQGLDIAINAVARLVKEFNYKSIIFYIYGQGPERENLFRQIEELDISDFVKIFDTLPLEEIARKMEEADLGIVPKRDDGFGNEAFSTKILEFMLMEIPVIVSATKIDKYYFPEDIVTFFKPGDIDHLVEQIKFCIDDPSITKEKVKKAKNFVDKITWENKKIEYLNIISKLTEDI